jgi:hypothetical protein
LTSGRKSVVQFLESGGSILVAFEVENVLSALAHVHN